MKATSLESVGEFLTFVAAFSLIVLITQWVNEVKRRNILWARTLTQNCHIEATEGCFTSHCSLSQMLMLGAD